MSAGAAGVPAGGAPLRVVVTGGGTGGHLYPGLAIARALVRADPRVRPFFVGALRGIEREVLPTTEFPHLLLSMLMTGVLVNIGSTKERVVGAHATDPLSPR